MIVTQLRELCSRYPPGTRLGLRCVIPAVVDRCGHVPNMLQDLLLQVYAGLPLASDLDRAVSSFRLEGQWPNALPSLLQPTSHISPDVPDACNANMSGPSDANAGNAPVAAPSSQLFPTHLHQHACVQRRSAQCGTRRRCRVCNNQIPHQSLYFHCSQNCRFTVCMDCFRSNNAIAEPVSDAVARGRCASEPPRTRGTALAAPPISGSAYGQLRFTRYVHMSREGFIGRINALVAEGRFAHIGVPQIRIEGTTGWGVWLRVNCPQGAYSRRPRLLCGVLFHIENRSLTFHGDATSAADALLPLFQSWTFSSAANMNAESSELPPLDAVSRRDPDSESSVIADLDVSHAMLDGNCEAAAAVPANEQRQATSHAQAGLVENGSSHDVIAQLQAHVLQIQSVLNNVLQVLADRLPPSIGPVEAPFCSLHTVATEFPRNGEGLQAVPTPPGQPNPAHADVNIGLPPPPPPPVRPHGNVGAAEMPPPPLPPARARAFPPPPPRPPRVCVPPPPPPPVRRGPVLEPVVPVSSPASPFSCNHPRQRPRRFASHSGHHGLSRFGNPPGLFRNHRVCSPNIVGDRPPIPRRRQPGNARGARSSMAAPMRLMLCASQPSTATGCGLGMAVCAVVSMV